MDQLLDRIEFQINDLVTRISKLESVSDQPAKFATLDCELIAKLTDIQKQYEAQKHIEHLHKEQQTLDKAINASLIELAGYRQQLEKIPLTQGTVEPINTQVLIDYASRIARFTREMPGNSASSNLPWPAEDQLRRGMLAMISLQGPHDHDIEEELKTEKDIADREPQKEQLSSSTVPKDRSEDPVDADEKSLQNRKPITKTRKPPKKISLDFDSDDD